VEEGRENRGWGIGNGRGWEDREEGAGSIERNRGDDAEDECGGRKGKGGGSEGLQGTRGRSHEEGRRMGEDRGREGDVEGCAGGTSLGGESHLWGERKRWTGSLYVSRNEERARGGKIFSKGASYLRIVS